ncbi:Manganese/iron superoxide dismutase [Dipodascopsis uninucleata]
MSFRTSLTSRWSSMVSNSLSLSARHARPNNYGFKVARGERFIHEKPRLHNESQLAEAGISGLYSPAGFKLAWMDYQNYLITELNKRTVETEHSSRSPFEIVLATARHIDQTALFNFASLTHNNHFYFTSLKLPNQDSDSQAELSTISEGPLENTLRAIQRSFSSIDEFRDHMKDIVLSMCGNGYVWLIEGPDKKLYLLATYNAGTPYDFARSQSVDLNGPVSYNQVDNVLKSRNNLRKNPRSSKRGPLPLLCINVWQHAYILDYGVDGKDKYFDNWWKTINWDVVEERFYPTEVTSDRETL